MHRARVFSLLIISTLGCGGPDTRDVPSDAAATQQSFDELKTAMAVAESKDPSVRLSAWQREWSADGDYRQPEAGVFETSRAEFNYRWSFGERDAVLAVTPRPDLDDEEKDLVYIFVLELSSEWSIGPRFIYEPDSKAGDAACDDLQQRIINKAIELEQSTAGPVYSNPFPESKAERIARLKGPNKALSSSLAYKTLSGSGASLSSEEFAGDVFAFKATADFRKDGTVAATLSIDGR